MLFQKEHQAEASALMLNICITDNYFMHTSFTVDGCWVHFYVTETKMPQNKAKILQERS